MIRAIGEIHRNPTYPYAIMKPIALIIAALSALFLSACNTMEGLGRDMQKAGSSMERSANR